MIKLSVLCVCVAKRESVIFSKSKLISMQVFMFVCAGVYVFVCLFQEKALMGVIMIP